MQLDKFQIDTVNWLMSRNTAILAGEPGVGKTVIACKAMSGIHRVLVVCPASMVLEWADHTQRWCGVTAQIPENAMQVATAIELIAHGGVMILSYDRFSRQMNVVRAFGKFEGVIFDECHYLKNISSGRTKAAFAFIRRFSPEHVWLMSGTIIVNRPIDLYSQLKLVGAYQGSQHEFGMRFCNPYLGAFGWEFGGLSHEDELVEILAQCTYTIKKSEVLTDLPDKYYRLVRVNGQADPREGMFDLSELRGVDMGLLTQEPLATILREHGMTKVPFAVAFILNQLEHTDRVFVGAYHRDVINALEMALQHEVVTHVITGTTSKKRRHEIKAEFQSDNKTPMVLIGQIISTGVGLTLTRANIGVMVEGCWNAGQIHQWVDRLHRKTQTKTVWTYFLAVGGTLDEAVLKLALKKEEKVNIVMEGLHVATTIKRAQVAQELSDMGILESILQELKDIRTDLAALKASDVDRVGTGNPGRLVVTHKDEPAAKPAAVAQAVELPASHVVVQSTEPEPTAAELCAKAVTILDTLRKVNPEDPTAGSRKLKELCVSQGLQKFSDGSVHQMKIILDQLVEWVETR